LFTGVLRDTIVTANANEEQSMAERRDALMVTENTKLEEIIDRAPYVVGVLDEYGVYFDPFTYITLKSSVADVAEYNALPDYHDFLKALQQALDAGPPPEWKGEVKSS
jgi:hypothetical protein